MQSSRLENLTRANLNLCSDDAIVDDFALWVPSQSKNEGKHKKEMHWKVYNSPTPEQSLAKARSMLKSAANPERTHLKMHVHDCHGRIASEWIGYPRNQAPTIVPLTFPFTPKPDQVAAATERPLIRVEIKSQSSETHQRFASIEVAIPFVVGMVALSFLTTAGAATLWIILPLAVGLAAAWLLLRQAAISKASRISRLCLRTSGFLLLYETVVYASMLIERLSK